MSAICLICQLPAPTGLAMLQNCLHCYHTTCLRNYVAMYGHCPHAGCEALVGEEDIRVLIFDPPQPTGMPVEIQDAFAGRVREVLNATLDRLKKFSTGSDQERAQAAQVGEAFELILREKAAQNGASSLSGEVTNFRPAGEESGWDKLMRIITSKEVKMVVVAATLVLICVFFWSLVGPGGLFAAEMGEIVTGMLATVRAFVPEILAGIAAAGTLLVGFFRSKKLED